MLQDTAVAYIYLSVAAPGERAAPSQDRKNSVYTYTVYRAAPGGLVQQESIVLQIVGVPFMHKGVLWVNHGGYVLILQPLSVIHFEIVNE